MAQWVKIKEFPGGTTPTVGIAFNEDFSVVPEAWGYAEVYIPQSFLDTFATNDISSQFAGLDGEFTGGGGGSFGVAIKRTGISTWRWITGDGVPFGDPIVGDRWYVLEFHIESGASSYDTRVDEGTVHTTTTFPLDGARTVTASNPDFGTDPDAWIGVDNLAYSLTGWVASGSAQANLWTFEDGDPLTDNDPINNPDFFPFFADGMDDGNTTLETASPGPGPGPPVVGASSGARFWHPKPWRFVVTDLDTVTLTFLDRLALNGKVEFDLNTPSAVGASVPSANPEVNILHTDDDPFLSEGNRLLYAFRREGGDPPWKIRAAGTILDIKDAGDPNVAKTEFTAFDPWSDLYARPCVDEDGFKPILPDDELRISGPVGEIALQLLLNTITEHGMVKIDAGEDWGGTAFYEGYIANTDSVTDYRIQRGKMVGEVWEDLCATELMDIELVPIYDPFNRPGYTHELNIYAQPAEEDQPRGVERPLAIFAWDESPRTLAGIDRSIDGRHRANKISFYNREGDPAGVKTNAASVTKFGQWWYEQFFPDQFDADRAGEWATSQLRMRKNGLRTVVPLPGAQQPPFLWDEYFVGDRVPVYSSSRLREKLPEAASDDVYQRLYGLTIEIAGEEGLEVVTDVRVSADGIVA